MSLNNEQLLLLDALAYYAELLNKTLYGGDNWYDDEDGYTDEDLGMDKIIELVDKDNTLKSLVMVYPATYNDKTISSVCLVDPATTDVYVIYVGNYAEGDYSYYIDEKETILNTWVENAMRQ